MIKRSGIHGGSSSASLATFISNVIIKYNIPISSFYSYDSVRLHPITIRVVILSVWRLTGERAGMPVYYTRPELGVLDIFSKYSLKIPRIYSNILEYFLVGRAQKSYG
jgi:hypothetical protein